MNLPNALTVSRIFLTLLFIAFILQNGFVAKVLAALIFTAASFTDFFDGYFAKKLNKVSNFGKLMDPIADKFLMLAAFFIFAQMNIIASWMFGVIALREIFITGFRLVMMGKGEVLAAEKAGKLKTVLQIVVISVILIFLILEESPWAQLFSVSLFLSLIGLLMLAVVILTLSSGVSYLWHNRRFI